MARRLRIQYEGALYHITCRGNVSKQLNREDPLDLREVDVKGEDAATILFRQHRDVAVDLIDR